MEAPTWLKPAILGGVVGAIATIVVGFNQAGWMLGGSAEKMAKERSAAAVIEALVPVCIGQSNADPEVAMKLAQLKALSSSYQQRDFVMKSGWATMPASDAPNGDLAAACAEVLLKPTPT
ncbi:MAG: hypothetical protein L0210_14070 [Rhodospirillales bacterium]|nr:hypothetical protein [Rhodospirillales bacterium]